MAWMRVDAARKYAGGLGRKTLYRAVAAGKLRAARIGAGRSLLFSDVWIDEWLLASAGETTAATGSGRLQHDGAAVDGGNKLRLVERRTG